jgi:hypothetical protein
LTPCRRSRHDAVSLLSIRGLPDVAPSYSELFAEGCFAQRALCSGGNLREAATARGLLLPLFPRREVLEPLDRAGGFSPTGFLRTNYTPETTWLHPDPDLMVWREERAFHAWEAHGWRYTEDQHVHVSERYSPWQLLYLSEALDLRDRRIALSELDGYVDEPRQFVARHRSHSAAVLRTLDDQWSPLTKLLVALQPRLWPYRSGKQTMLYEPGGESHVDQLARVAPTFDAWSVMRRFELSLDDVATLHLEMAERGSRLDPMPRWHRLTEAAPRKVTDDLRGRAHQARDFYDAAYLLRGLYYLATMRWLPRPDQLDDYRTVSEHRRRHLPRGTQPEREQRLDLKNLLIREGLYPHRIHFFVEGHTEKIVLDRLLPFLGYHMPGSGMSVTNIHGVDQAQRSEVIFASATRVASRTVLIADREGTLSKTLDKLRADGLFVEDENVLLWSDGSRSLDFEEANFSDVEILRCIQTAARRRCSSLRLDLNVADLRAERSARTRPRRPPPALTGLALRLAEDRGIRVSKPELAAVLAEKLVREIRRAGHLADAGQRRPLLAHLSYWIANEK